MKTERVIQQKLAEEYWIEKLQRRSDILLNGKYPQQSGYDVTEGIVPDVMANKIRAIAGGNEMTELAVYLAFWGMLLHKYFDLAVVPVVTANNLFLHLSINGHETLREILQNTGKEIQESLSYADYDSGSLFSYFEKTGFDLSGSYTFGFVFSPFQSVSDERHLLLLELKINKSEEGSVRYTFSFDRSRFDPSFVAQMAGHYIYLLSFLQQPGNTSLQQFDILSADEHLSLLSLSRGKELVIDDRFSVASVFEAGVLLHPDAVAVESGGETLSYVELNKRSNQLAHLLIAEYGVVKGDLIAIHHERSALLMVAILGVLKAGAGYVPVDRSYPAERKRYLLEDSGARLVLTDAAVGFSVPELQLSARLLSGYADTNPVLDVRGEDRVYLLYTSGTTGRPKGVSIAHHSVLNLCAWLGEEVYRTAKVAVLTASVSFDASVQQLFGPLLNGGRLVLFPESLKEHPRDYVDALISCGAEVLDITPGYLRVLLGSMEAGAVPGLKYTLVGGEALSSDLQFAYYAQLGKESRLINVYGVTECTVNSTYEVLDASEPLHGIGRPLPNTQVYILDSMGHPVATGVRGEICIGGIGVGLGYHGQEAQTHAKFIADPYGGGAHLYRTGDGGYWLADGNIAYCGRLDSQVKIRGYRIELPEIVACIRQYEGVRDVVVKIYEEHLVGYVIMEEEDVDGLRDYLQAVLPSYMVPDYLLPLASFPLTVHGKVDMGRLPDPFSKAGAGYVPAETELEKQLVQLWEEVLGVSPIGISDNFFELGGHSLKAMRIMSRIYQTFNVTVSLRDIFACPTIEQIAACIGAADKNEYLKIPRADEQSVYDLSHAQLRLWIQDQVSDEKLAYTIAGGYRLSGKLDIPALENAISKLIERHEILRTVFITVDGVPKQKINSGSDVFASGETFDLAEGPLFNIELVSKGEEEHLLLCRMHHIITDEWSVDVMMKDLCALYNGVRLPALRIQYRDYAIWQKAALQQSHAKEARQYWMEQFSGELPVLSLQYNNKRPAVKQYSGDSVSFSISEILSGQLIKLANQHGASLFMVLLSAVNTLLYKYTGQKDFIIGTPVSGREHPELENQIGFYVNTLALRNRFSDKDSFEQLLAQVRNTTLAAFVYQDYPFDKVLEDLELITDHSRSPLFDVMVVMENASRDAAYDMKDLVLTSVDVEMKQTKYDLIFTFRQEKDNISVSIEYDTALFDATYMDRVQQHFMQLLLFISADIKVPLSELAYYTSAEHLSLLSLSRGKELVIDDRFSVASVFEAGVLLHSDAVAVVSGAEILSYAELNKRSNQLAHLLIAEYGVVKGDLIAIHHERSALLMVAILGVLKAGAGYVPVDRSYPAERKRYLLEDSGARLVLTDAAVGFSVPELLLSVGLLSGYADTNPVLDVRGEDRIYLLYTSGTTGRPKGVSIAHHSVLNLCAWLGEEVYAKAKVAVLTASVSFDASVQQLFGPLLNGGRLVLFPESLKEHPRDYVDALISCGAEVLDITPGYLRVLLGSMEAGAVPGLKYTLVGGEALSSDLQFAYYAQLGRESRLINVYGVTECTVNSTYEVLDASEPLHGIGRPLPNTQVYILDSTGHPVATGVRGEICIGGIGVGLGYHGQEAQTYAKFIADPYGGGAHLYRTGDGGYWLADGNIAYCGRLDSQVKIRGYRIELSEIVACIRQYEGVRDVVVKVYEEHLVGYVIMEEEDVDGLRNYLQTVLPSYMVPEYLLQLASFPLTVHGKVDMGRLPDPFSKAGAGYVSAETELEKQLLQLWEEFLGVSPIGISDNFFELGGHSLKAMRIMSRMHKELQLKIPLQHFFSYPTIKQLAAQWSDAARVLYKQIPAVTPMTHYELSHAQQRLWLTAQYSNSQGVFNMAGAYRLKGRLDIIIFKSALTALIERHESLRTVFIQEGGVPRQKILSKEDIPVLRFSDISAEDDPDHVLTKLIEAAAVYPFDIESGPLFSVHLIQVEKEVHVCLLTMHHIISDGWSDVIFIKDLMALYNSGQAALAPLKIQYKDYAAWQNDAIRGGEMQESKTYLLKKFAQDIPSLRLPLDADRPAEKTYAGNTTGFEIDRATLALLKEIAVRYDVSMYMLMLTTVNMLLYRFTGNETIVVGSPVAGRGHADLEQQIGFYANTLALVTRLSGEDILSGLLEQVKITVLEALHYQDYPFDMLVEESGVKTDRNRSPLFDVMMVMQEKSSLVVSLDGLEILPMEVITPFTQFDLVFNLFEEGDGLQVQIMYNTDLFEEDTIRGFADAWQQIFAGLIANPAVSLKDIDLSSGSEHELLSGYTILDGKGKSLPSGVVGNLHISADTGICARWRKQGVVEILTPDPEVLIVADHILFREEIECMLLQSTFVADCRITLSPFSFKEGQRIVAHVICSVQMSVEQLTHAMSNQLPSVMMDILQFNPVSAWPLTSAGDVDMKLLSELDLPSDIMLEQLETEIGRLLEGSNVALLLSDKKEERQFFYVAEVTAEIKKDAVVSEVATVISDKVAHISGGVLFMEKSDPVTLSAALIHTGNHYKHSGIIHVSGAFQDYGTLLDNAKRVSTGLYKHGLQPGDSVILQIEHTHDYFSVFWGCILAGVIPVTVAIAPSYDEKNAVVNKLLSIWQLLKQPDIICSSNLLAPLLDMEQLFALDPINVLQAEILLLNEPVENVYESQPADVAFYQLSSGSTGTSKCIQITHRGVVNHILGMKMFNRLSENDVSINWLPFDHVAALLSYHIRDVYLGIKQVQMSTASFLSRPLSWFDYIEQYKVSQAWSPNFGFKLINDALQKGSSSYWDLSSINYFLNAGEQVTLPVVKEFLALTAPFGIRESCIQPGYGMAETCTGIVHQSKFDFSHAVLHIRRNSLDGQLVVTNENDPLAYSFISVGRPRPDAAIRIMNADHVQLPEGNIGNIQVNTPSLTPGYLFNEQANEDSFTSDGWYITGDRGFILDGQLVITGREKETILIRGTHHYCHAIEDVVNQVAGVLPTYAGSCSIEDQAGGTEGLLIFFSPLTTDRDQQIATIRAIQSRVTTELGISPYLVIPVSQADFPRTTSGKIQRNLLKQRFQEKQFDSIIRELDLFRENTATMLPEWFYRKIWVRKNVLHSPVLLTGDIIIFCLDAAFADDFKTAGARIVTVVPGTAFLHPAADRFIVNPASEDDYKALAAALIQEGFRPDSIVHNWSNVVAGEDIESIKLAQIYGIYSLMNFLRFIQLNEEDSIRLWVLTSCMQQLSSDDNPAVAASTLEGFLRSLSREEKRISSFLIDVDTLSEAGSLLIREMKANRTDDEVAYRNGVRFVSRLGKYDVRQDEAVPVPVKNGGHYVIAGGAGELGMLLANYLHKMYNVSILLIGRKKMDEALFSEGIVYSATDISDEKTLLQDINGQEERWGCQLDGIFHLAGEKDSAGLTVARQNISAFEQAFSAKVYGTLALFKVIENNPDAIYVAFSSVNSFFGGYGISAYAAASSFLDHFTVKQANTGRRVQVINWSWWEDIGMSKGQSGAAAIAYGFSGISATQGLNALQVALHKGWKQVFVGLDDNSQHIRRYIRNVNQRKAVVLFADGNMDAETVPVIKQLVRNYLPESLPFLIRKVSAIPLLADGKADQQWLLSQLALNVDGHTSFELPVSDIEKKVSAIWGEVLNIQRVGLHENFFELGGDSIKATRLVALLCKQLQIEIILKDIFENNTVGQLAKMISTKTNIVFKPIAAVSVQGHYALSHAQERLWLSEQDNAAGHINNIAISCGINTVLDIHALEHAFRSLIERHEILRTNIIVVNDRPRQKVCLTDDVLFNITYTDLRADHNRAAEYIVGEQSKTFDLSKDLLIRVVLIQLGEDRFQLLLTIHHIVCDGLSMFVICNELQAFYDAYQAGKLPVMAPLKIQYKDYANWHNEWLDSTEMQVHQAYWKTTLGHDLKRLEFPLDYPRPTIRSYQGDVVDFHFDQSVTNDLLQLGQLHDATLYMVMLTVYKVLLYRYTLSEDVLIGTPVGGRDHADLAGQIGMYINTVALRTVVKGTDTFTEVLAKVKEMTLSAFAHQAYPFDKVVNDLQITRRTNRSPLFDIGFTWNSWKTFDDSGTGIFDLFEDALQPAHEDNALTAKHDIWLYCSETPTGLELSIEYNNHLFRRDSMVQLSKEFEILARFAVSENDLPISACNLETGMPMHAADGFDFNF